MSDASDPYTEMENWEWGNTTNTIDANSMEQSLRASCVKAQEVMTSSRVCTGKLLQVNWKNHYNITEVSVDNYITKQRTDEIIDGSSKSRYLPDHLYLPVEIIQEGEDAIHVRGHVYETYTNEAKTNDSITIKKGDLCTFDVIMMTIGSHKHTMQGYTYNGCTRNNNEGSTIHTHWLVFRDVWLQIRGIPLNEKTWIAPLIIFRNDLATISTIYDEEAHCHYVMIHATKPHNTDSVYTSVNLVIQEIQNVSQQEKEFLQKITTKIRSNGNLPLLVQRQENDQDDTMGIAWRVMYNGEQGNPCRILFSKHATLQNIPNTDRVMQFQKNMQIFQKYLPDSIQNARVLQAFVECKEFPKSAKITEGPPTMGPGINLPICLKWKDNELNICETDSLQIYHGRANYRLLGPKHYDESLLHYMTESDPRQVYMALIRCNDNKKKCIRVERRIERLDKHSVFLHSNIITGEAIQSVRPKCVKKVAQDTQFYEYDEPGENIQSESDRPNTENGPDKQSTESKMMLEFEISQDAQQLGWINSDCLLNLFIDAIVYSGLNQQIKDVIRYNAVHTPTNRVAVMEVKLQNDATTRICLTVVLPFDIHRFNMTKCCRYASWWNDWHRRVGNPMEKYWKDSVKQQQSLWGHGQSWSDNTKIPLQSIPNNSQRIRITWPSYWFDGPIQVEIKHGSANSTGSTTEGQMSTSKTTPITTFLPDESTSKTSPITTFLPDEISSSNIQQFCEILFKSEFIPDKCVWERDKW